LFAELLFTLAYLLAGRQSVLSTALLIPQIDVVSGNQSLPIPLEAYTRSKRAIQIIPLLIAMGIMAGIGTGTSAQTYQKMSTEFNNDIERFTQSIKALHDEVDSLTSVVHQNRCAEKGGTCLFLNEEYSFYTNKSAPSNTPI
jgi:hypothetical protein